jgi:hypothetical protein
MVEVQPIEVPEDPRVAVTTRLKLSTQERIRVLGFRTRKTKQSIIDEALDEFLDRHGA